MPQLGKLVASSLRWQAGAKLISQIVTWTITIAVMRILAPEDYGLMASAMLLVGLTSLVAEMGIGSALVQSREQSPQLASRVCGAAILLNTILYAGLLAISPLLAHLFSDDRIFWIACFAGLQLPISSIAIVPEALARRRFSFRGLSIIELVSSLAGAFITLGLAQSGLGVWALVAGNVAATLSRTAGLLATFGPVMPLFTIKGQRQILGFGSSITANRVIWYFYSQADIFIAGKILGQELLGFYSCASNLATLPMQKIMSITNQVAFSAFSSLQDDAEEMQNFLRQTTRSLAALSVGLLWGMAAVAPDLIPLLLGQKWVPAVLPLQVISLVIPLRIIAVLLSTAGVASGGANADLKNSLFAAAILTPAFLAGAHLGGLVGLAAAWPLAYPVIFIVIARTVGRRLGVSLGRITSYLVVPIASGILMILGIWLLRATTSLGGTWQGLFGMILAGGIVYVSTIFLLDRRIISEFMSLIQADR